HRGHDRRGGRRIGFDVLKTRAQAIASSLRTRAGHTRKSVARPRKMKNPPLSVIAVIKTEEPSAGSRPSRIMVSGISTPAEAASTRFNVIAAVITRPSDTFWYSQ